MKEMFWISVAGASIGWMLGLSSSPVMNSFMAPVLGVLVAALAAISSLSTDSKFTPRIKSFSTIAVFLIFCSASGTIGLYFRNNGLLIDGPFAGESSRIGFFNASAGSDICKGARFSESADDAIYRLRSTDFNPTSITALEKLGGVDQDALFNILDLICDS